MVLLSTYAYMFLLILKFYYYYRKIKEQKHKIHCD